MKMIIIGGGQVGSYLASLMLANGNEVTIVDSRTSKVELAGEENPGVRVVLGNGSDPVVLEEAGIREVDAIAAVTGEDETNLVVSTLAKLEYGVPRVVARVNNPKNAWLFTPKMGVDAGLNQADLIAHLVEEEAAMGSLVPLAEVDQGRFVLTEETLSSGHGLIGRKVGTLEMPLGCQLSALIRQGMLLPLTPSLAFQEGDILVGICESDQAEQLAKALEA